MMPFSRVFKCLGLVVSLGITLPVFAESAPVFDADTLQQQFEHAGEPAVADTAPPPPATGQDSTFMPVPADAPATTAAAPQPQAVAPQLAPANTVNAGVGAVNTASTPEQRLRRVEQQLNALQSSDISARTDSLQNQVQALRSQVEQLTHQLTELQTQQKAMYSDLDKRLSTAPASAAPADTAPASSASTPAPLKTSSKAIKATAVLAKSNVKTTAGGLPAVASSSANSKALDAAEEQKIYQSAYDLIKAKKYSQAATTLQGMLQKYPSGQFASNAHYWLGELYGLMGKNDQALNEFSAVVKSFPSSPRVSDAQLKVGLIYASQNQWSDAKMALTKVTTKYPGTASARLATEQLAQIKQAGH